MNMEDGVNKNAQKIKIILLGDSGVGKTSLINQYVNKRFQKYPPLDFHEPLTKDIEVQGKHVILQIHDTGGRERQEGQGLEPTFFNNAKACMFVYDVHDPKSLENLENWHNEFRTKVVSNTSSLEGFPFVVLGNKDDQDSKKEVNSTKASEWCRDKKIELVLTSAKDNKNVVEAFKLLAELVVKYEAKKPSTKDEKAKVQSTPPETNPPKPPIINPNGTNGKISTNPPKPPIINPNGTNPPKPPTINPNGTNGKISSESESKCCCTIL